MWGILPVTTLNKGNILIFFANTMTPPDFLGTLSGKQLKRSVIDFYVTTVTNI